MAVRFDADGEHPAGLALGITLSAYTAIAFFKRVVDRNGYSTVFCIDRTVTTDDWAILQTLSNGTTGSLDVQNGTTHNMGTWVTNQWYAVSVTYAPGVADTGQITYLQPIGGALVVDDTTSASNTGFTHFRIGDDVFTGEWFNGSIEGVKLWDHVLTQVEVEAEFAQLLALKTSGLLGSWPMQDDTDWDDYSAAGRDLTPGTGMATDAGDSGVPLGTLGGGAPPLRVRPLSTLLSLSLLRERPPSMALLLLRPLSLSRLQVGFLKPPKLLCLLP